MIREIKQTARYYSEFFDFFYRVACISNDYAYYLLSKRLIGRLLDFYLSSTVSGTKKQVVQFQEEVRRSADIRTPEATPPLNDFLGQQAQVINEAASHYDDLLEKKFEKNINY